MRNVMFLLGIEDSNLVEVHSIGPRGPRYVFRGSIDPYKDLRNPRLRISTVLLGGMEPQQFPVLPRPDLVFNCISDPDTSSSALVRAIELIGQLQVPHVLNRPVHVLKTRRDELARAMSGIPGIIVPKTIRIRPSSHAEILGALERSPVRYPAIIRRAGTHGGETMILLRSPEDASLLDAVACDGGDYYLTEFIDCRDRDGYYRKLRLVVIDGEAYPRHLLAGHDWKVHAGVRTGAMRENPDLVRAEKGFLEAFERRVRPALAERLAAINERIRLDYYTIDCALRPNGNMVLFEANASGNALRQQDPEDNLHLRRTVRRLRTAFGRMLLRER